MATTTNTTTNDSSSMRTPVTLSSGDLVSRLVAATPPYLYNVQLTPHSFFFSEMLRSYVQPKPEATTAAVSIANASASATISSNSIIKRRKRPWRDTRDRPLELTTKDKNLINHDLHNHSHHHHHSLNQQETYFHQELMENQLKSMQTFEGATRNFQSTMFDQKSNGFNNDVLKQLDENNSDFTKNSRNFFDDTSRFFSNEQISHHDTCERTFDEKLKVDHEINLVSEHRNKIDFPGRNSISGLMTGTRSEDMKHTTIKTCSLTGSNNNNNNNSNSNNNSSSNANNKNNNTRINDNDNDNNNNNNNNSSSNKNNSNNSNNNYNKNAIGNNNSLSSNAEFIPSPLWYQPYPMAQSYPGIDPLHFFIDLRVSGHIWDRKLNERQLPFKGKHCSAFDVPQTREFNIRPLNLTRDEATTSRGSDKNYCGTHFILKNLTKTYKDIEKISKMETKSESHGNQNDSESTDEVTSKEEIRNSSPFSHNCHDEENTNGKDLRALIGLELVVDYVKEPKEEPNPRASPETLN